MGCRSQLLAMMLDLHDEKDSQKPADKKASVTSLLLSGHPSTAALHSSDL